MEEVQKIASLIVKYKNDRELVGYLFNGSLLPACAKHSPDIYNSSTISSCFTSLIKLNLHTCMQVLLDLEYLNSISCCIYYKAEGTNNNNNNTYYSYNNSYREAYVMISPLHLATISNNSVDSFKLLCSKKYSDLNKVCTINNITAGSLYYACEQNDMEKMKLLVKNGADVNSEPSCLLHACKVGNYEMVHFLIENSVKTDIKVGDKTPLLLAAQNNYIEIVDLLIHGR